MIKSIFSSISRNYLIFMSLLFGQLQLLNANALTQKKVFAAEKKTGVSCQPHPNIEKRKPVPVSLPPGDPIVSKGLSRFRQN